MSREVPFRTPFCVFLLTSITTTIILSIKCVDSLPDRCLEVVSLDIDEIEDHLSGMNLTDVPTVKMMAAGFKCPISALPFGALKLDWSRLMLLQEAQPDGSAIKRQLVRLMRILIIAYYQMEESFEVIKSDLKILQQAPEKETAADRSESRRSSVNQSWTAEATRSSDRHRSRAYPSLGTLPVNNDDPSIGNSTARIGNITSARISTRESDATTGIGFVPIDAKIPNVTSSIVLDAVTMRYHPSGAAGAVAKNVASKALGNCLRKSIEDILSRSRPDRRSPGDVVFERLKSKKHGERAAPRRCNEINGRAKNADVPAKISPTANDFRRYVQLPAEASLNISAVARLHRGRGLKGFRTNPRKSRKRASLNSDDDRTKGSVLRCLVKIKKTREVARRYAGNKSDIAIEGAPARK